MKKVEFVQYGNTILKRAFCPQCRGHSLVVDDYLACCGYPLRGVPASTIRVISEARVKRKRPSAVDQVEILENQDNRCLYCGVEFGSPLSRDGRLVFAQVRWDHYVPYAYSRNNKATNFVASCQICNAIKSSKMFETLEDARAYVRRRRDEKRWNHEA